MKNDKPKVLSKFVKRKLSLKEHKNRDRTATLLKRQGESQKKKKKHDTKFAYLVLVLFSGLIFWYDAQSKRNGWRRTFGTRNVQKWRISGALDWLVNFRAVHKTRARNLPWFVSRNIKYGCEMWRSASIPLNNQARTPTEKCFRPTYRAAKHGFTLHDLSYYTHLNLIGEECHIKRTLKTLCDPTGVDPCSMRSFFLLYWQIRVLIWIWKIKCDPIVFLL